MQILYLCVDMDKIKEKIRQLNIQLSNSTNFRVRTDGSGENTIKNRGLRGRKPTTLAWVKCAPADG